MAHFLRGWVDYKSDYAAFATFSIKVDTQTATNNGVPISSTPTKVNFWPYHRSDLRAVYGVDNSNRFQRDTCTAVDPTSTTLYQIGRSFQDNEGNTYTVHALKSERLPLRNLK